MKAEITIEERNYIKSAIAINMPPVKYARGMNPSSRRERLPISGRRTMLYIDCATKSILKRAGNGNRSAGCRLVAEYWENRNK